MLVCFLLSFCLVPLSPDNLEPVPVVAKLTLLAALPASFWALVVVDSVERFCRQLSNDFSFSGFAESERPCPPAPVQRELPGELGRNAGTSRCVDVQ